MRLTDMGLTREQVDPDFKGTSVEFATKYGHVNLHTKEQIEYHNRHEALSKWLGTVSDLHRAAQAMLAAIGGVEAIALREWASKPAKAEKLRLWHNTLLTTCEAFGNMAHSAGGKVTAES
jgi:hypothetical protein